MSLRPGELSALSQSDGTAELRAAAASLGIAIGVAPGPAPAGGSYITDTSYRSVRLDTCCANPQKHAIPSHDIYVCGNCGGIDVQGKHFSKAAWQVRANFVRKRGGAIADGPLRAPQPGETT